ncbi:hypothetical protein QAD02_007606 [Eretmocerus hayati]|uniref:Uncharacterized protein n=1 Tax=Eretmocerus hayati TaxID=131215 RepID=A0ACC2N6J0_9HYME|nr:hypothetical protein QAD02_007606 [Eretmocerus hayati]
MGTTTQYYSNGFEIDIRKWSEDVGEIFCYACKNNKNKGPIKGFYAQCRGCDSTYHPSCAERANLNEHGVFLKCCALDPNSENTNSHSVGQLNQDGQTGAESVHEEDSEEEVDELQTQKVDEFTNTQMLEVIRRMLKKDGTNTIAEINRNTNEKTKVITDSLKSLSSRLMSVEEQITELDNRVTVIENSHWNEQQEISENVVSEVKERIYREKNVIMFGVPEFETPQLLQDLLTTMLANAPFQLNNIQYHRIGKTTGDKCRPLKLKLDSLDDAKWMLINQRKFCPDSIRCSNDKTLMQQQVIHNVLNELEDRRKSGENNLLLKYVKGVPTIIVRPESSCSNNSMVESDMNVEPTLDESNQRSSGHSGKQRFNNSNVNTRRDYSTKASYTANHSDVRMPFQNTKKYPQPQLLNPTYNNNSSRHIQQKTSGRGSTIRHVARHSANSTKAAATNFLRKSVGPPHAPQQYAQNFGQTKNHQGRW